MKIRMLAAAAAVLLAATPALAQPDRHDHHDNHGPDRHDNHGPDRHDRWDNNHHWRKGERLPKQYWSRDREVTDWRARHLRQPPRGYHWVRDDSGNYILAALAGGLIASIIAGSN